MSSSNYDPFDYGLIKPTPDEAASPTPQGDPEDVLFDSESETESPSPICGSGPLDYQLQDLESAADTSMPEDVLFGEPAIGMAPASGEAFEPAPPPAFEEPKPTKQRPARPPAEKMLPPPWLREQEVKDRRVPSPQAPQPNSGAAPRAMRPRREVVVLGGVRGKQRSKGRLIMPAIVLIGGLGGAGYLYWVLDRLILAGIACAIGLIGSMFCGVLFRSRS